MRLLLDTHALLWALLDPSKLGKRARKLIESTDNTRVVSAASAWEIATKFRLGKLPEAENIVRDYPVHLATMMATELAITSQHALAASLWRVEHRDPFDRILAAQSVIEGIALVTCDTAFNDFPITAIW